MTTHSTSAISVSDSSSAAEFIEWMGKEWLKVPMASRKDATLSVSALLHMRTNEIPPSMSVMVGISYSTDER